MESFFICGCGESFFIQDRASVPRGTNRDII